MLKRELAGAGDGLKKVVPQWAAIRGSRRLEVIGIGIVLVAYTVLAFQYSTATPILESYDEQYHFAYVLSIALDHGLPIQDVAHPGPWGNEGSQPPLYYALAAAVSAWTAQSGFEQHIEPNPYATRHVVVEQDDNRNYFVHHRDEDYPYTGNVLAFHLARWLSICFGAAAVAATYLTGRLILPGRPLVALGAAAFQAFIPSFVYVSATASNDAAVIALSSLALWQMVRTARAGSVSPARVLTLGILSGLATIAKLSALPLVAVGLLAVYWGSGGRTQWQRVVRNCLLLCASFGAVTGWWLVRNWVLYGEWLGTDTMNRIAGLRAQPPSQAQLWDELRLDIERNFWAAFGSGNVHPPDVWLLLPRLLALAGLVGCALALARRWPSWRKDSAARSDRRTLAVFGVWIVLLAASLAWWLQRVEHLNGRLLYPLLTPLALAVMYGLWQRMPQRASALLTGAVAAAMLGVAAAMLPVSIAPAYARPPGVSEAEVARTADPVDVIYGDQIRLRGYRLREREIEAGLPVHVDFYWQAPSVPAGSYTLYAHLLDPRGRLIGGTDSLPGRGAFPTVDWTPGPIYHDWLPVYVDSMPDEPIVASVVTGWYDAVARKGLAPRASDGRPLAGITVGHVRVPGSGLAAYTPSHRITAQFADLVDLVGYDLSADALTLYWQARTRVSADFTVFVHVLDDRSVIVAQADGQPRGGDYPTSYWLPGEIVRDPHALRLPEHYAQISVGLYRLDSGERLPVSGQAADSVRIAESR